MPNICSYSCKIEYIEGKMNIYADMLSHLPHRPSDSNDDNELSISDKTFEVSMINSSNINPKDKGSRTINTKSKITIWPIKLSMVSTFYKIMYFTTKADSDLAIQLSEERGN